MKIAIIGASGQGKTTLTKKLVLDLGLDGYDVTDVVEFARSYIEKYQVPRNVWQQLYICDGQRKREGRACNKYDIVVCDSTSWLASVYAAYIMDFKDKEQMHVLRKVIKQGLEDVLSYDYCFYLPKKLDVKMDQIRKAWDEDLNKQSIIIDDKIMAFMTLFNIKYKQIESVDICERVNFIRETIKLEGKKCANPQLQK